MLVCSGLGRVCDGYRVEAAWARTAGTPSLLCTTAIVGLRTAGMPSFLCVRAAYRRDGVPAVRKSSQGINTVYEAFMRTSLLVAFLCAYQRSR